MFDNGFVEILTIKEIIIRIIMSILVGGMIGYERGRHNNRPAGFRTHILVCLGATIVSLIQDQLRVNLFLYSNINENLVQLLKTDLGRMGAQVVSGIGFLGAGTIMRDKGVVGGLTTAASIWATGCLGLGIGWGFYNLAIPCCIAIIVVLVTLKQFERSVIEKKCINNFEIIFNNTQEYSLNLLEIYKILSENNIEIKELKKNMKENKAKYKVILFKQLNIVEVIEKISLLNCIEKITLN